VLGIVRAFKDLSKDMAAAKHRRDGWGIAEALVATAIGPAGRDSRGGGLQRVSRAW